MESFGLMWFRRDLRLEDQRALYYALKEQGAVLPVFVFDREILDELPGVRDARINFIYGVVVDLKRRLEAMGSSLWVYNGKPLDAFRVLISTYHITGLYMNRDYEPYAMERDSQVVGLMEGHHIPVKSYKDQVVYEADEVLKKDGTPYTVFTPYMRRWKQHLQEDTLDDHPVNDLTAKLYQTAPFQMPSLESIGFQETFMSFPPRIIDEETVRQYHQNRDFPAVNGTSRLGVHLRFGTISIRRVVARALQLNETWLNELIWREFFMMILRHFPWVVDQSFKPEYDDIEWRNDESDFKAWINGKTGYPLVDAGMRELNATGYMHNRPRMVTASFLTKHLLIDWRWGESYFAEKLLDYELASNNGGWQWAAGSGCDAAPYFRIFNPYRQASRFDPHQQYIKNWIPEIAAGDYVDPIVDHKHARERALKIYKKALNKNKELL